MQTATTMPVTQQKTQESRKSHSLSRPTSAWTTIRATVVKELRIASRYVPNLIGSLVSMGLRMLFFMLLSGAISVEDTNVSGGLLAGRDLFIFFSRGAYSDGLQRPDAVGANSRGN